MVGEAAHFSVCPTARRYRRWKEREELKISAPEYARSTSVAATWARRRAVWLAVCLISYAGTASAIVVVEDHGPFHVTFYGSGDGGSDSGLTSEQDWTAEQRSDVGAAVDAWANRITNAPGRQIQLHMFWREMDSFGTNVLGGSSSAREWDGTTIWNAGEYVWKEGVNYNSSVNYDTFIQFDITAADVGGGWNFGSGSPAGDAIDFRSVTTHELGHSVGFSGTYDPTRKDFGRIGTAYGGLTAWDSFLVDSDGTKAPLGGGRARDFNATDDPVFWDGPLANAFYGSPVPIYAPNPYQPGSSLAHVDEASLPAALMSPFISTGQTARQPTALEWKLMQDMGWAIAYALGDVDGDGDVDDDDIDLLCDNLGNSLFDLDGDGDADGDDLDMLVHDLVETSLGVGTEYGDFNLDGRVNTVDLTILATNFGVGDKWRQGNANCDADIDTTDLTILATNFGFVASEALPEPGALSLLALGAVTLVKRRRR